MFQKRIDELKRIGANFFSVKLDNGNIIYVYGKDDSCARSRAYMVSKGGIPISVQRLDPSEHTHIYFK